MLAVFFDLGNVLVHLDFERPIAHLRRLAPAVPDRLSLLALPEVDAVSRGRLAPEEFLRALSQRFGGTAAPEALRAAWCDMFDPWPEMEALAAAVLDAGHPTYLASNTDPLHFTLLRARLPVLERMDGLHLSYEVGALKPEPEFFATALSRYRVRAEDALLIDDRSDNIEAAAGLGIRGHVFDGDVPRARAFLRAAGARLQGPGAK